MGLWSGTEEALDVMVIIVKHVIHHAFFFLFFFCLLDGLGFRIGIASEKRERDDRLPGREKKRRTQGYHATAVIVWGLTGSVTGAHWTVRLE